jgi:NAD(P)H-hydrate epimerase
MRGGAGAVVLATPRAVYPVLARKLTEVMVKPVTDAGGALCEASLDEIGREVDWADVIVVGPGIGMSPDTGKFMKNLLKTSGKRFLIDADGLNHLAGNNALKGRLRGNTCILTPHSGEFSRLTGLTARELEGGRIRTAVEFAKKHGITLVLKGSPTITVAMTGEVFINPTGNRGMATAGMGDVLSGLVGAIWGESGDPVSSAYAAVYYHGLAGDTVAARIGYRSMMAGDVLKEIPEVLHI